MKKEIILKESEKIKIELFKYLFSKYKKTHIAIPEVSIGRAVIDILMLNGEMHIFEIKSKTDSLTRLSKQIETYKLHADKVTVVADRKFEKKIENLDFMQGVGLIIVDEHYKFVEVKKSSSFSLAKEAYYSYWSPIEMKESLRGFPKWYKYDTVGAYNKLLETLTYDQTRRLTIYRLKNKYHEEFQKRLHAVKKSDYTAFLRARFENKLERLSVTPIIDVPAEVFIDFF